MVVEQESRIKKTLLNARVNLIFYFLQLILSFFSRKIFIDCLGADFLGLTGTLGNLLGFLNLAELGVGSAIGYLLYKPLFDHDHEKINEIISVMGYLYHRIGFIILGSGIILSGFLPLIYPLDAANAPVTGETGDPRINYGIIFIAFYAFLGSSLLGYFINYRQNLLGADQRNYVVTAYYKTMYIGKILVQMVIAYWTRNLWLWIAIEFGFGIFYSFVLNWRIDNTYPWLKANIKEGKQLFRKYPEVMKKTKQLFVHKIGTFFLRQALPFLIYAFSTLAMVTFYQNYTTITDRVSGFFSNIIGGIGASVGNLIAEGNKSKILSVFWELLSLRFFIAGLIVVPVFLLIDSFICIWLGFEYLLSIITLYLILIPVFINVIRGTADDFIFGYGLFWDTWAPIAESIILVTISIVGGIFWGINGVLIGPIVSLIAIVLIWKPYLLFHWGIKSNFINYWIQFLKNLLCICGAGIGAFYFMKLFDWNNVHNFLEWSLRAFPVFIFYVILSYIIFLMFTSGMKLFNKRLKSMAKKSCQRFNKKLLP